MQRAAHQLFDSDPVLNDPLAIRILGLQLERELRSATNEEKASLRARGMRAFFSVRSRVAEDALADAVNRGVTQYVLLGAGLDTFAYRNPFPHLKVFEVDFPATQKWKRELLENAAIRCPSNLTFAAIDFEHQTLEEGMRAAGMRRDQAAFFSCLGVIPYLTDDAVTRTFSFAASFPKQSGIVFDYAVPRKYMPPEEQPGFDAMAARVAAAGEPFRFFATPATLALRLKASGFTETDDLDSSVLNHRYFAGRQDGFLLRGRAGHIMLAWIR
jgi:methyltransferase (TIGR00027 family)